jgi:hypothetical protein
MVPWMVLLQAWSSGKSARDTSSEGKRIANASERSPTFIQYRGPAAAFVIVSLLLLHLFGAQSFAAVAAPVAVESIEVAPDATLPGTYPNITANIRMKSVDRPAEPMQVNVVAVITRPDRVMKSWQWKKIVISPESTKSISVPKEYETRLIGDYKIEFVVYSSDMKRRFSALSRTFTIAERLQPAGKDIPQRERKGVSADAAGEKPRRVQERNYLGAGIYANTFNPAGGATILVWPFEHVGIQASYTVGTFTSYEGRLLAKLVLTSGFNPYIGVGYLHVSHTTDVIDVNTTFTDSTVSGVVGIEVPLGKKIMGYLEVSGANIDLQKVVTNGAQTVQATVDYAPVTIGVSLVYSLF